jgi:phenol 2-monooxygenase (NADPH)
VLKSTHIINGSKIDRVYSMMVQYVDVLICGSGSAGICAATWLARQGISCKILEKNNGPMQMGQADGVQCRTVEVFESFGLSEELLRTAYHVLEVAFWSADATGKLVRTRRTADTQPGLSHQPHVILNQAHINGFLLGDMKRNGLVVDYGHVVKSVQVESKELVHTNGTSHLPSGTTKDDIVYPVTVTTEKDGVEEIFKAKYALVWNLEPSKPGYDRANNYKGSDGAHSNVRKSLGYKMIGDSTDSIWGVMDIYPRTNFPDIRKKVQDQHLTLHCNSHFSIGHYPFEFGKSISKRPKLLTVLSCF